jgi:hypothetical protein
MATTAKKAAPGKTAATKTPVAKNATAKRPAAKQPTAKRPAAKPPVAKQPKPATKKVEKPKKPKLVRDSFTMPEDEYALLAKIKKNCVAAGFEIKKSELLRIGVSLLAGMDPKKLQSAQKSLPELKAGRPKKQK